MPGTRIRELQQAISRAVILAGDRGIQPADFRLPASLAVRTTAPGVPAHGSATALRQATAARVAHEQGAVAVSDLVAMFNVS
jgi:hypothetical protein